MKQKTKKLLCFVMVGFLALMGLWYLLFAPKGETYHEGENRNLAAAPSFSFSSFWDGTLSNQLESWLLDRFFARDAAMDISMGIKDLGSVASFEDALVIMGREDDALTNNNLDEDLLEDMVSDLLSTQPESTIGTDSTDPSAPNKPLAPEDYPELLAIKSSSGGKITIHKRHRRTYALALTSVLNRVAALLPEDGELMFTMVPQSNVANEFLAMDDREYFTSEAEEMIDTFSAENVHAFSTAQILSDSLVRGDYVYFRTDMHWTPEGAYLVYCEMVKAAGLTPTPWEDFNIETEENFLGTYYRDTPSNYMKNNPDTLSLISPNFPLELRRVTGVDTYTVIPLLDMNAKQSDRFSIYLGGSAGPWTIAVSENNQPERCLVITDSFGLPVIPMLTTNYSQVHYLDTRYYSEKTVGYTVAEMMKKYNITDVYMIVGDLHSYGSSFLTYDLPDQLGDQ